MNFGAPHAPCHGVVAAVAELGGSGRSYRRERARAARAIVSEVYSPPRVRALAGELKQYMCAQGLALDLTTVDPDDGQPWDLSRKDKRDQAKKKLHEQGPALLIGTPMCTPFTVLQRAPDKKRPTETVMSEKEHGRLHLGFMCELYQEQHARGGYFLQEHPDQASSWQEPCIQRVLSLGGVGRVTGDQC